MARASARPRARRSRTARSSRGRPTATAVRALDARNRAGALSSSVRVKVPRKPSGPPRAVDEPVAADRDGHADPARDRARPAADRRRRRRPHTPPPPVVLTEAMVDRLFWRAGFGPTQDAARRVDRPGARRARRLVPGHPERARRLKAQAAHVHRPADRPDGLRHRARARVDRPHAARDQPAAGPARVLLAPPLGGQPRRRHPVPVGRSTTATGCSATPTSAPRPRSRSATSRTR